MFRCLIVKVSRTILVVVGGVRTRDLEYKG